MSTAKQTQERSNEDVQAIQSTSALPGSRISLPPGESVTVCSIPSFVRTQQSMGLRNKTDYFLSQICYYQKASRKSSGSQNKSSRFSEQAVV